MGKTKKLNITATCMCVYNSSIEVPDNLSREEAIAYAKLHISEIPIGMIDGNSYISDSDIIDEENSDFEEN